MVKPKYLLSNLSLVNILLAAVIAVWVYSFLLPFFYIDIKYTLPTQKSASGEEESFEYELSPPSPADYMIISEENLFHPERRIPPEKKAEQELPKPEFVLYGTMIMDNFGVAYLEDLKAPRTTPGRGKRQVALKEGDAFSGFTLKEIETDRILMVRGEERITVNIIDPQKPKKREPLLQVSPKAPAQSTQTLQRGSPAPSQLKNQSRIVTGKEPLPTPQKPVAIPPPGTPFESTVRGFFDRSKK